MFHVLQRRPRPDRYLERAVQTTKESQPAATRGKGILTEVAEVALLAIALYLVINFVIQTVHVIGSSMLPTVDDGDYLIATKIDYRLHAPQRGDIIIMRDPYDPTKDFIKRVIGVPGDRILIRGGQTYINGRRVAESYVNPNEPWTENADWPPAQSSDPNGLLLGSDEYFVMGDNRNHSSDSRVFGQIHRDQIEAHAWVRVLPLSKFGPVDGARPRISSQAPPGQAAA